MFLLKNYILLYIRNRGEEKLHNYVALSSSKRARIWRTRFLKSVKFSLSSSVPLNQQQASNSQRLFCLWLARLSLEKTLSLPSSGRQNLNNRSIGNSLKRKDAGESLACHSHLQKLSERTPSLPIPITHDECISNTNIYHVERRCW